MEQDYDPESVRSRFTDRCVDPLRQHRDNMPSIGKVLNYAPGKPKRSQAEKERAIAQLTIPVTTAVN